MNLVIYFGLLFVLLCFSLQQFTFGYEDDESNLIDVEVDASSGFQRVGSRQRDDKVSVVFENKYLNESVDLFWLDDGGQEYLITNILSDGNAVVDTTHYHRFLGRGKDSLQITFPRLITIVPDKKLYTFEPPEVQAARPNAAPKPFLKVLNQRCTSSSAKFRSHVPSTIEVWYDDGKGGTFQGTLDLGKEYTVNSYEGHVFFFTEKGNKNKVYARHKVSKDQVLYIIEDKDRPAPSTMMDHFLKEEKFMAEYFNRTKIQWRHYFGPQGPRGPPSMHMWPAEYIGQKHTVISDQGYWNCLHYQNPDCKSKEPITYTLEVISLKPKAFIIKNFLNEIEADSIINYAAPRVDGSFVGNNDAGGARKSDTRTSRNTWIPREAFAVTETLFQRAEKVLNISHLDRRNTEDMQVVHYVNGQKYDNHHDWGVSGYAESRYITLLLYLNDMVSVDAGGETAFPKAADGKGIKVHPGKGSAVLFYNLLEDGNGDDLSLHAALPIKKGEKWLANFWVWDPKRK